MNRERIGMLVLRAGIAFAFIYAAVSAFIQPINWIGYFPPFLQEQVSANLLLTSWGIIEIILGIWILSGKKIFIPSIIASLSLAGLIIFNWNQMDVIFRDVTILAATVALVIWSYPKRNYLKF